MALEKLPGEIDTRGGLRQEKEKDNKGNCPPTSVGLETRKTGPNGIPGFLGFKRPAPGFDRLHPEKSSWHSVRSAFVAAEGG